MWLSDLKIVLPDRVLEHGSIRIEDGIIAEIIDGCAPLGIPNLHGLTLVPGLIDLHGDMLEHDVEPRPSARFPTELGLMELDKRYAGTGITTAFTAISFSWRKDDIRSQESAIEMIETVHRLRGRTLVDVLVHTRFEVTNTDTAPILSDLLERGRIQLVSIMDHTPGQGQYKDIDRYLNFMQKWLGTDLNTLGEHKERIIAKMKENIELAAARTRDWDIVAEVSRIAAEYGVPVASHDDDTVEKVVRQADIGVTISEFPVTLEAARAARDCGMKIVMGAPNAYRGESTSNNLSAMDAIRAGLVDILATDYYPAAMLHVAFKLARDGVMPLEDSIKLVSTNAADAMGMHDRGRIVVGAAADLVLVNDTDGFPRVCGTIRQGEPIYWDAHLANLSQLSQLFTIESAASF